jgi:two-component system cell cycle sensor histidine kinase/response regulator CckA
VAATVEDHAGILWFGTWGGGLNRFDRRTEQFKAYRHDPANPESLSHDYIRSLLLDHEGNVWAGTEDGLNRLDMRTGRFTVFGFAGPIEYRIYRVLAEGADGSIWMGTYEQGLQRLDVPTGKIVNYKHDAKVPSSLSNNRVNALCVDHSGTLWVGTQNGLNRFDRGTGEFTIFDEHDGLPNNAVEGILEDAAGNLWVSTGNGLSRFDPRARTVKNYFTDDGLPGDEFNDSSVYFRSPQGEMFFGGVKGVTAFFPDRVTDKSFVPRVVLTEFRLFGEPVQIGGGSPLQRSISFTDSLSLSHGQNDFSLEFASLSYANSLRNRYRYKLDGLNEQWTDVDSNHRLVTFPFLPPGDYTFRVQGSSNRGVWNEQGVALRIRILPPWWGTWWFRIAAGIVVLASVWIGYTLRVRSVHQRNRELVKLNLELQQSQRALHQSADIQRRLNRELRAISNCNQTLMRAAEEQALLNDICRIVCEDAGYRMAWVGYAEHDDAKSIKPVAWAGIEDGYLAGVGLRWHDTEAGRGPAGTAIRTGETVYEQDLATSPSFAHWRERARKRGYRSMIALPLKDESSAVFGVLAIYSSDVDAFTPEEIRLLEELAGDLAFGIMVLRARIERNEAEESLHQSQEKYRAFFEQNLAGNYISTPEGVLLACNPAFLRMFGFASEAEAKQMNVASLYTSPENREAFLQQLKQQRHLEYYEKEFRRKDGKPLYVTENAIGTFGERGELVEIHGFLIDETARRKTEQQLRHAQKMEAIGQLAGGIAHDFNNILGIIIGYSEILLGNPEIQEGTQRRLQQVLDAGQRAASLTRQLLAFSRKQVLQPKVLDLNLVLKNIDKMLRRLIGEEIEVQTALDPDLNPVKADPSQMEQVILNLCINARDAMPEGGTITIETKNVDVDEMHAAQHFPMKARRYVRLAVSDNGVGMDKETLSHVFEPFFTTKGPDKGTGLGLATVYGIVKQSAGYVWGYSEPGQGSVFSVYLPTALEDVGPREGKAKPAEIRHGQETILLVEDVAALRAMTRELLERFDYTVLEAKDGEHAIQIAREYEGNISLLLTDVSLPKMKGPAVAKSLVQQRSGMAVLYMSGYADNVITQSGVLKLGTAFLQKPFTREELARKVREVLDTREGNVSSSGCGVST